MTWLKQSTAVTIMLGPFVDEDDGKTAETGLTITQAEVRLSKNGGNMAQKGEATSLVHDELGMYTCLLNTTDTGTLGSLMVAVHESGALPVFQYFMVVPANVWDSMFGADMLDVSVVQWLGTAPLALDTQLVQAQANQLDTQAKADVNAEADTALSDYDPPTKAEMDTAHALLATPAQVATELATYDGPTHAEMTAEHAALDALLDAIKAVTDLLPNAGALNDLAAILTDTGTTLPAGHAAMAADIAAILVDTGTTLQAELDGIQADTEDIQTRLPAALIDGRMDSDVAVIQNAAAAGLINLDSATIEGLVVEDERSLYGVVAALTHKREIIAGPKIRLYKANDTDVLVDIDITEDSGQDPISGIDPPAP